MAWNYEKGCEEKVAYKFGDRLYSPPAWSGNLIGPARDWEKAEAIVSTRKAYSPAFQEESIKAIKAWELLEAAMNANDIQKTAESRRKYLEWLAREEKVEVQMGFTEVAEADLPLLDRIIAAGYRTLSKTEHPDLGGTDTRFNALKNAKEQLSTIVREVRDIL